MSWINRKQSSFSESFFSVFILGYLLFHHSPLRASKCHLSNSTRTVLAKGFWRGSCNSVRWINRTQSSFSESFFPLFKGRYFIFTVTLYGLPSITLRIPQEQSKRNASWGESCNSVWCINRTHGSFSECFFPVLNGRYLLFNIALYGLPNISLQITQEQPSWTASWGESCNSVRRNNRTQSSFSNSFFPVLNGRYFLFHHSLYGLPNITLQIPQEQS